MSLLIRNGIVAFPHHTYRTDLLITDGRITSISSHLEPTHAERIIEAQGLHVLPGIIDSHVHFREPGFEYREDFSTGSKAAAAGGVTLIFDMPNGRPSTDSVNTLREKLNRVASKSYVNFGLYAIVTDENLGELQSLAKEGIIGFKLYMAESAVKTSVPDDGSIFEAMQIISSTKKRICVHAENNGIIKFRAKKLRGLGKDTPEVHLEARPSIAEAEAISRAVTFSSNAGSKLHVCHVSSREGVRLVTEAKAQRIDVTAETCPHYLTLSDRDLAGKAHLGKINPPIRSREHQEALWQGLNSGSIDIVSSDHAPVALKEKEKKSVWEAPSGFVGVEVSTALMLDAVNKEKLTLDRYVEVSSANPARAFDLYPRKGLIRLGADADLTIVDLQKEWIIKNTELHSKTKVSPYDGRKVKGAVIYTIVNGFIVYKNGEVMEPPRGKFVSPNH